jgi:hypothetical protein
MTKEICCFCKLPIEKDLVWRKVRLTGIPGVRAQWRAAHLKCQPAALPVAHPKQASGGDDG